MHGHELVTRPSEMKKSDLASNKLIDRLLNKYFQGDRFIQHYRSTEEEQVSVEVREGFAYESIFDVHS